MLSDDIFEGKVYQIRLGSVNSSSSSSTSTSSETVVTYEVVITADNPDLKLKPRLTANVTIYTDTRDNVITVPNKALRFYTGKTVGGQQDYYRLRRYTQGMDYGRQRIHGTSCKKSV